MIVCRECGREFFANSGCRCPECFAMYPANPVCQIRVIMGSHWSPTYIRFRRHRDLVYDLHGRSYRNPEPASYHRLTRLLFERGVPCFVDLDRGEIVFGDQTPMPDLIWRKS